MILLYSGGLDSELYRLLLKPKSLVYFDNKSSYSIIEKSLLPKGIIIDKTFNFKGVEEPNKIIPFRNIHFILSAFSYHRTVALGITAYDVYYDKQEDSLTALNFFLKQYSENPLEVITPFRHKSKGELITECLSLGLVEGQHFQKLRTCYSASSIKGCGECSSCYHKAIALAVNGLFDPNLFDKDPRKMKKHFNSYMRYKMIIPLDKLKKELAYLHE